MNPIYEAAVELQRFVKRQYWQSCVIDGLAVYRWGEIRATKDVDISLLVELGDERPVINALLKKFSSRLSDAMDFALQNRVLVLTASNGIPIDVSLASFWYEQQVISRASSFRFDQGVNLLTASAEDLIVLKLLAERPIDLFDVRGILVRQPKLDWDYLVSRLQSLAELKPDSNMIEILNHLRDEVERSTRGESEA